MTMQPVTLGKTQSGIPGFFTNGYLAWSLKPEQYREFENNPSKAAAYAKRLGFKFVQRENDHV